MKISQLRRFPVTIAGETAWIGTAGELAIALDVLNGRQDRSVLEQLRQNLPDILRAPRDIVEIMQTLQPHNQMFLIDALGKRLSELLCEARHLRDLLAAIATDEVKRHVIDALGESGLRTIIVTAIELASVLAWTCRSCGPRVIDLLGQTRVGKMIRHGEDLSFILSALDEPSKISLIESLGLSEVAKLVLSGRDLALLLRALPRATAASLLDCFTREQLVAVIGNEVDWAYLLDRIEPAETAKLLEKLGADEGAV